MPVCAQKISSVGTSTHSNNKQMSIYNSPATFRGMQCIPSVSCCIKISLLHTAIFNIFDLIDYTKEYLFLWATILPCVDVCLRNTSHSESLAAGGPWIMSSPEYQGWQCVWILYEELEFSNSYFHLNICRGAAQSGFMSLLGMWHSQL